VCMLADGASAAHDGADDALAMGRAVRSSAQALREGREGWATLLGMGLTFKCRVTGSRVLRVTRCFGCQRSRHGPHSCQSSSALPHVQKTLHRPRPTGVAAENPQSILAGCNRERRTMVIQATHSHTVSGRSSISRIGSIHGPSGGVHEGVESRGDPSTYQGSRPSRSTMRRMITASRGGTHALTGVVTASGPRSLPGPRC
jgi:hypothetical protein